MSVGLESAVIPYNFLGVLLSLVAVAALALRIGGREAAAWAVLIAATTHILWQLGVDPRIDGFLCVFVTGAVLASGTYCAAISSGSVGAAISTA